MSVLNTSILSNLTAAVQLGQDAFKAARQAVKGLGQDSKYFSSNSKKGGSIQLTMPLGGSTLSFGAKGLRALVI